MDLTGSIADATAPLSSEVLGSVMSGPTGSSFVDTLAMAVAYLPYFLLEIIESFGADLGSGMGGEDIIVL